MGYLRSRELTPLQEPTKEGDDDARACDPGYEQHHSANHSGRGARNPDPVLAHVARALRELLRLLEAADGSELTMVAMPTDGRCPAGVTNGIWLTRSSGSSSASVSHASLPSLVLPAIIPRIASIAEARRRAVEPAARIERALDGPPLRWW